jgi:hypothetical protein
MKRPRRKPQAELTDIGLGEALARFLQTNQKEVDEAMVTTVLEREALIKKRIEERRQEIEDGGRPRKGRFRI